MRLITDYLFTTAQDRPNAPALVCGGERFSYRELATRAASLAGYLVSHGLQKGDRVLVWSENSPEAVVAIFGTLRAGGCIVVINPLSTLERLTGTVSNCAPKFLVAPATRLDALKKALDPDIASRLGFVLTDGEGQHVSARNDVAAMDAICDAGFPDPVVPTSVSDLAAIIYTSGSMGEPKGATFLHGNIDAATEVIAEYLEQNEKDVILSVLPLASSYGLLQILVPFRTGGSVVLEKGLTLPYNFIRYIKEERVTGFAGNPTLFAILLRLEEVEPGDLSTVRYITNAAAALPVTFVPRLKKMFPHAALYMMHGMTECLRTSYLPPAEVDTRTTSIGKGMRNVELWIADANGHRLGWGETGEMMVQGPTVMQGYWNNPEATARALLPGKTPWENTIRSNDLFRLDQDGYFHFVARADEVIKSRGEKVSPVEVEDVLYGMDAVLEARVVGVPDQLLGTAVKAEIVLKKDQNLTPHQVKAHCRNQLEEFKIPRIVEFVTFIPRTPAGKITRKINAS